jgi:alpha-galactosidase
VLGGLEVQIDTTNYSYPDGAALETLLSFRNDRTTTNTSLLCEAATVDMTWPVVPGENVILYRNNGTTARLDDFAPFSQVVLDGDNVSVAPMHGLSSYGALPFFALEVGRGNTSSADASLSASTVGAVFSVGWSGTWELRVEHRGNRVRVRVLVPNLCSVLLPGEGFRLARVLWVPFGAGAATGALAGVTGAAPASTNATTTTSLRTRVDASNLHRRIIIQYKVPRKQDGTLQGALTSSFTSSLGPFTPLSNHGQTQHIAWIAAAGLDAWWLDAGWFIGSDCENEGSFPQGIGNWILPASASVNATLFPEGIGPLATAATAAGLRAIVWFDPEVAYQGTFIFNSTYRLPICLTLPTSDGRRIPGSIVDLGNPDALAYLLQYSSDAVEQFGLNVFRVDINAWANVPGENWPPAISTCWDIADSAGGGGSGAATQQRRGMSEVKYITNLYSYWDTLTSQFKDRDLFLDNCAGGGRRIDLETLSRSIPLWRHDGPNTPEAAQAMTMGISAFAPISGSGVTSSLAGSEGPEFDVSPYNWRSAGAAAKVVGWGVAAWESVMGNPALLQLLRAAQAETTRIREITITGDYYPLTDIGLDPTAFAAYQFHTAAAGYALVFRRPLAPEGMTLKLRAVDPSAPYTLRFYRNYTLAANGTMCAPGSRLRSGLELRLPWGLPRPTVEVLTTLTEPSAGESLLIEYFRDTHNQCV